MSHDNKEALIELECGSSLAEHEYHHGAADCDPPKAAAAAAAAAQFTGGEEDTIESVRALLASDVLTDEGKSCTMFASPFEVPRNAGAAAATSQCESTAGNGRVFLQVPLVYCDQTASNRPVKSIERFMEKVCLPLYGNTHTNTSITGSQR